MDKQIIHRLKHIYELEKFQIAYYTSQLSSTDDKYYLKAFTKMAKIEEDHAEFFAQKLAKADLEVPKVKGALAEIAGSFVGESLEFFGPQETCKLGITLANRALSAYQQLIEETKGEPELQNKLMEFLLDQQFHALWLHNYALRLKRESSQKNTPAIEEIEDHPTFGINLRWL